MNTTNEKNKNLNYTQQKKFSKYTMDVSWV